MIEKTAIICHGPSLLDSNMGNYIDSFQYVLRFPYLKNWQVKEHYGKKTSYFCATVGRIKTRIRMERPELGYFLWSKPQHKLDGFCLRLIKKFGGADASRVVESWRCLLKKCHHPYFSHGTAAVCIAAEFLKKPIVVFGADLLKDGKTGVHYTGSWVYEGRKEHKMGHPLDQERRIIDMVSEKHDLEISFI